MVYRNLWLPEATQTPKEKKKKTTKTFDLPTTTSNAIILPDNNVDLKGRLVDDIL